MRPTAKKRTARSAKNKGVKGQNEVRDLLVEHFPWLRVGKDIRTAIMGENGADIKWSEGAFEKIPLSIEVKRRKTMKGLYDFYDQAKHPIGKPAVFVRADYQPWLVITDADFFMELLKAYCNDYKDSQGGRGSNNK